MEVLIAVFGLAWFSNLVAWSGDPFQSVKDRLKLSGGSLYDKRPGVIRRSLIGVLNCPKCLGFWIGFLYAATTGGGPWEVIIFASIVSIVSNALEYCKLLPVPNNS